MEKLYPKVGIGVIVLQKGKILLGRRKVENGSGTWALPGGHLEFAETWTDCAKREVSEETGIKITNLRFVGVTNDVHEGNMRHYITIFMQGDYDHGEVENKEPHKCFGWEWIEWEKIPQPRFKPLDTLIRQGYHPLKRRHDKLVRDKIIEIIEASGDTTTWYTADLKEYKEQLKTKLAEEVCEFLESGATEELADILEVIHSIAAAEGVHREQLQLIQKEKRDERGGFDERTILVDTKS